MYVHLRYIKLRLDRKKVCCHFCLLLYAITIQSVLSVDVSGSPSNENLYRRGMVVTKFFSVA